MPVAENAARAALCHARFRDKKPGASAGQPWERISAAESIAAVPVRPWRATLNAAVRRGTATALRAALRLAKKL